jgi:prepilin-type N-terminal cleavage/methylation domain-containing protein
MRHARPHRFAGSRGFTLVESIIVLVALSIAAATIISMQGNIFFGQSANKDLEVGVQLMQECAEQILATRRQSGYTAVNTGTCNVTTITADIPGGFRAPSVDLKDASDTTIATCASSTCTATISISKGSAKLAAVTLRLVNY